MKSLYFSSIILSVTLLSINLNSMEIELQKTHVSKGEELLAKLTDNNKFELSNQTKENIAKYCLQRVRYSIKPTKTEFFHTLSSDSMYKFLRSDTVVSAINSAISNLKEKGQDIKHLPFLNYSSQDVDTHTDLRLFYCFPQIIEKYCNDRIHEKLDIFTTQGKQTTPKEYAELLEISLSESRKLAEDILELLKKQNVQLAENILLIKHNKLDSEQSEALNKKLDQVHLADLIDMLCHIIETPDIDTTIAQQSDVH